MMQQHNIFMNVEKHIAGTTHMYACIHLNLSMYIILL